MKLNNARAESVSHRNGVRAVIHQRGVRFISHSSQGVDFIPHSELPALIAWLQFIYNTQHAQQDSGYAEYNVGTFTPADVLAQYEEA